jgi:hypothetical protein
VLTQYLRHYNAARPHRSLGQPTPAQADTRRPDAGGTRVAARNPYWDQWGVTIADPDGYRLVLSTRCWP